MNKGGNANVGPISVTMTTAIHSCAAFSTMEK